MAVALLKDAKVNLYNLVDQINEHPSVNNSFFKLWTTEKLSLKQIEIFARNYWEWTYRFPEFLASLIKNTKNIKLRTEFAMILYSEMGNGDHQKSHVKLFENFFILLAEVLGNRKYKNFDNLVNKISLTNDTIALLHGQEQLYNTKTSIGVGAQLAIEWQAYTMIRNLYEGARLYKGHWNDQDKFHESCEFFYTHIGATEKEHKLASLNSANSIIDSDITIREIEYGFHTHLYLIEKFWNGLTKKIIYC